MKKRQIIFKSLKALFKIIWNLVLLCIYGVAKLTGTLAGFLGKVSEKLLNKHN